jgi:hypothetical protein
VIITKLLKGDDMIKDKIRKEEKERLLNVIEDHDYRLVTDYYNEKFVVRTQDFHYNLRHNGFIFESKLVKTQRYEYILFHIGCMIEAPYTKIAFITISTDSSVIDYNLFKDEMNYGYHSRPSLRFAYSVDRDEKSIKSVKDFIKTFDADNLEYIDNISETLISDVVCKPFAGYSPSINVKEIEYKNKFYNEDGTKLNSIFVDKILKKKELKIEEIDKNYNLKEKNDFIFVTKNFLFKNEDVNHIIILKVGRNKLKPNEKHVVIDIRPSSKSDISKALLLNVKIKIDYEDIIYSENEIKFEYINLNNAIKHEIKEMSDVVTFEDATREIIYALYSSRDIGHYEGDSETHSRILAMSSDMDNLRERYNKSVKSEAKDSLLMKEGKYSVSYNGNTGGGCSSVSHSIYIKEFRDFDMPDIEK